MRQVRRLSPTPIRRYSYSPSSSRRPRPAGRTIPPLAEYKPNPKSFQGFTVPKVSPVPFGRRLPGGYALAIGRLGLRAAGFNPVGLAANIAFEVANGIDFSDPWALQSPEQEEGYYFPDGGQLRCTGGPSGRNAVDWGASSTGTAWDGYCGLGGQVPNMIDGQLIGSPMNPNTAYMVAIGPGRFIPGTSSARMTFGEVRYYARGTARMPEWRPARAPRHWPLPRARPNPAAVREVYQPAPNPTRYVKSRPYQRPSVTVSTRPNGSTSVRNDLHNQLPPTRGEKEKKAQMAASAIGRWIYRLYDATTEASEIVDILYDNLGTKCKGAKGMSAKANCVYRNLSTLDIPTAIGELIQNHYEDKIWGKFYSYGKRSPFGAQLPGGTMPRIEHLSQIRS